MITKQTYILKYLFDYIFAFILILILLPLIILIAFLIKIDDRNGPIIFKQKRVGKDNKDFVLYKFRTMIVGAENKGNGIYCAEDDPRITRVGKILRKFSLDEIPQLLNILKGEMSFVGPRPTLRYQVEKYNKRQMKRLSVKPGITGWAQVNGRNSIPWSKRIELDLWYIENWSLWLDIKILFLTFMRKDKGVYGNKDIFDL